MFVGKRMTSPAITTAPGDTIEQAARLLAAHRIHRLPVVEKGALVGIVSDTDIRNAALRDARAGIPAGQRTVGEIMTREVITVSPRDTVEDALLILQKKRLGALPVVEAGRVVGIITKADVLAALVDTLDIEGIGTRLEILLARDAKTVARFAACVADLGVDLRSLVLAPHGPDRFAAFLRVATIDLTRVREKLKDAGFPAAELQDFLG